MYTLAPKYLYEGLLQGQCIYDMSTWTLRDRGPQPCKTAKLRISGLGLWAWKRGSFSLLKRRTLRRIQASSSRGSPKLHVVVWRCIIGLAAEFQFLGPFWLPLRFGRWRGFTATCLQAYVRAACFGLLNLGDATNKNSLLHVSRKDAGF